MIWKKEDDVCGPSLQKIGIGGCAGFLFLRISCLSGKDGFISRQFFRKFFFWFSAEFGSRNGGFILGEFLRIVLFQRPTRFVGGKLQLIKCLLGSRHRIPA
jgi:hypothetical protein